MIFWFGLGIVSVSPSDLLSLGAAILKLALVLVAQEQPYIFGRLVLDFQCCHLFPMFGIIIVFGRQPLGLSHMSGPFNGNGIFVSELMWSP